jgi:cytochrome c oxidase accessory protein FixG
VSPTPANERVLSTLNEDGTRHLIRPKLSRGRFLTRRRVVGYALIALFVLLPRIHINGRPALLIDLMTRELSLFGAVFRPSDGVVLMMLGLTIALAVFLLTALFGRVWCGWGCPQTVYLENVFRPIERWLEGTPAQQRKLDAAPGLKPMRILKWAIYAACSFALANVFLAYFVGTARLEQWVFAAPTQHLGGFMVVMSVSALMLFDFAYFREQACIVACPYGRLQSVLLDRQSLIVGYDTKRGEPRAKRKKLPVVNATGGDCVDCGACVATCPTGIDIRDGLQMECIGCAQCVDACDGVMDKLSRKRGLIRYTSQDELAGKLRQVLRARTVVYPALLAIAASLMVWSGATRGTAIVWVERNSGPSFVELPDGKVAAQLLLKVENDSDALRRYTVTLVDAPDALLRAPEPTWQIRARASIEIPLFVDLPRAAFVHGERKIQIRIVDDGSFEHVVDATLLGPDGGAR